MHRFSALLSALFLGQCLYAQEYRITGFVKDKDGQAMPVANVSLLNATDSTWIRSELTDDEGKYQFTNAAGTYIVDVQLLGYLAQRQVVKLTADMQLPDFKLEQTNAALKEVVVSGRKQVIEQGPGKTILNVDASVTSTGSTAYDILKRSPGVTIDMEGNVNMQGKQGVLVLINDKPTYLAGKELEAYLKSLTGDNIAQIELITQPSAKYDAAGNAGIINIKEKKQKRQGLNGNLSSTLVQGVYLYTPHSVSANYNTGKLNVYARGSYFLSTSYLKSRTKRQLFDDAGNVVTDMDVDFFVKETLSDYALKTGMDYTFNEKTNAGLMINGAYHPNVETDITISRINDMATGASYSNYSLGDKGFLGKRMEGNLYLNHTFSKSHSLALNADALYNGRKYRQYISSSHYDVSPGIAPQDRNIRSKQPFVTDAVSLKADYTGSFSNDYKLEAGLKSALVTVDVDALFDVYEDGWKYEPLRSNHFKYTENINAAYASLNKSYGEKWKLQLGLRAEQANITGHQMVQQEQFDRSNISFFPTAYASYKLNEKNQFELNYGRRIGRPNYRMLNPFAEYAQQYFYETGNPELLPVFTNNIELKHSLGTLLTTKLSYSITNGTINTIHKTEPATGATYTTLENNGYERSAGFSVQLYHKLTAEFEMTLSANSSYTGYGGIVDERDTFVTAWSNSFAVDTTARLGKGWTAELHADCGTPGGRESLVKEWGGWFNYSAGVSKRVLKDTGTITLSMQDPTHTSGTWTRITGDKVISKSDIEWNSKQFIVSFNYRFGANKESREQKRSAMDESGRM